MLTLEAASRLPLLTILQTKSQLTHPGQLHLSGNLSLPKSALTQTYGTTIGQLDFVFDSRKGAWAVMWKGYAGEGARA